MNLEQRVYSVLVVSAAENFNNALSELLPESNYYPIRISASIKAAKREVAEREYDYVLINSPLPDDDGTLFAIDTCNSGNSVVLLLVRTELHAGIYHKVAEHGVFTLPKPTSKSTLSTALNWMSSARERMRKFEKKTLSIEEKMSEIRIVNRAKWLLIREQNMDEPEAHRYIEKQAMDCCMTRREVAEKLIKTYSQ